MSQRRQGDDWAAGAVVVIAAIIILILFSDGCSKKDPSPPPPPPPKIELPSLPTSEEVGHKVGKVTGDAGKGFFRGLKESWWGKSEEKTPPTSPQPEPKDDK